MNTIWKRLKNVWLLFWEEDEYDVSKKHLSKADKRSIWYGIFIITTLTIAASALVLNLTYAKAAKENEENVEAVEKMIAAYIASATEDEYEEVARTLRRDLVFGDFSKNKKEYIQCIPNTADPCRLYLNTFPSQVYLLCNNTGMLYSLDIFEDGNRQDCNENRGTSVSFGYDEVSEGSLIITKSFADKSGEARLERKRGIISIQRMKGLFCNDCIESILDVVDYGLMPEFVIMDGKNKTFYPIEEGALQIGDYSLEINYKNDEYYILVNYMEE